MPAPKVDSTAVHYLTIDADMAGQRVDNYLLNYLKGVPKSRIYRLLRKGEVRVNKGRVGADYKLVAGDQLRIPPVRVPERAPKPIPGDHLKRLVCDAILYEDADLIALNKPTGVAVHGGSGINLGVIEILRHHYASAKLELVHRIDRDTSGVLLVAKRRAVLRQLQEQFRASEVRKTYQTLVCGRWPRHVTQVTAPLLKNQLQSGERMVKVATAGKASVTNFKILQRFAEFTLLEASPISGRTHQIRVHTQFTGYPIAGDDKYGEAATNKQANRWGVKRLFLHAAAISFQLPNERGTITLEAPLAADLVQALTQLPTEAAGG